MFIIDPLLMPELVPAQLLIKLAEHAEQRLAERSGINPGVLQDLRVNIRGASIPEGTHHAVLPDGSYAVIKEVGRGNKKKHVIATVLSPGMRPPGYNLSTEIHSIRPGEVKRTRVDKGPGQSRKSRSHHVERRGPNSYMQSSSKTTSEVKVAHVKDRLMTVLDSIPMNNINTPNLDRMVGR